ncbi:MAG: DNA-binding protein WhiA [Clostridiales bacterium]|nr:DNA-binding protein WhiA [Clostridiales bacterium]
MSFSSSAKEDLVKIRLRTDLVRLAELAGIAHTCGALTIGRGRGAVFTTETLAVGKLIVSLASALYTLEPTIELSERERRRPLTLVTLLGDDAERLLFDTGLLLTEAGEFRIGETVPEELLGDDECRRAFLRGAFLGSGSCTNPYRGYHLEIVARSDAFSAQLLAVLVAFGPQGKTMLRREKPVVYLKGDDVSAFLALIGANGSALKFESARAERDFRNYVNRKTNCETANIEKTVYAATEQRQAIEVIEEHMGLNRLPAPLYEAAILRLNHPEATLQELAELAEIGKSGMNHRLARLVRIAKEIRHG